MRNTLYDLNNHLFAALERLNDESLTTEELENEVKRAHAITGVANTVVNNANLQLQMYKQFNACKEFGDSGAEALPRMMSDVLGDTSKGQPR